MRLPQELLDEIIALLHDDIASLKACSTTSLALLSVSSTYLLHNITFSSGLKVSPNAKLSDFNHALQNSPRLRANIQEVHLAPTLFARRMMSRSRESPCQDCSVDPSLLNATFSHLSRLRSVTLKYCRIGAPQDDRPVRPLPHAHLENVVLGTLHSVSRGTSSSLGRILSLFADTRIDRLEVGGQWSDLPPCIPHMRLHVSHLVFHECSAKVTSLCLDVLCSNLSSQSLNALDVSLCAAESLTHLDMLVTRIGDHLRELRLDLSGIQSWPADSPILLRFVQTCTQLRVLQFTFLLCIESHLSSSSRILALLQDLLSCSHRSVQSVLIALHKCPCCATLSNDVQESSSIPWLEVRQVLHRCVGLDTVIMEVGSDLEVGFPAEYGRLREAFLDVAIVKFVREFSVAR